MNQMGRNVLTWVALGFLLVFFYNSFMQGQGGFGPKPTEITYTEFMANAGSNMIQNVTVKGQDVTGDYTDGTNFKTFMPAGENIVERLEGTNVEIKAESDAAELSLIGVLLSWFPMLLLIGVWIFFMKKMNGGGGGGGGGGNPFSFGKSKAKMMNEETKKVTFADVAGINEAKEELMEIVEFLKDPQKFQRLGGKIPKGALLIGPPGTGKTLTARAVAGEAEVPFFSISGSDFVEMFVGVGASRVRDMFEQGKKNSPCIIFIDEIDAVGRKRGGGYGGGNDEREQTLNQMLVEMDGFSESENVIIIAATNRPDVLDPALLRPGRFDRQVTIPNPDLEGREKILAVHARNIPLAKNADLGMIARGTPGFSGADLASVMNESALLAARRNKRVVTMDELEEAKDKVMMGAERRTMSKAMDEEEKRLTAYHEAGHAVVTLHEKASDPIYKATIIPRGRALGFVMRLPEKDRMSVSREKLHADLAVAMGGRVAEEIIFGYDKVTTGASGDIQQATDSAKRMVTQWGLSDKVGMINYAKDPENQFAPNDISDDQAQLIDEEIKAIVEKGYKRAQTILKKHADELEAVAQGLLKYETLSGEEIKELLETGKVERMLEVAADKSAAKTPRSSVPSTVSKAEKKPKKKPVAKRTPSKKKDGDK